MESFQVKSTGKTGNRQDITLVFRLSIVKSLKMGCSKISTNPRINWSPILDQSIILVKSLQKKQDNSNRTNSGAKRMLYNTSLNLC